MESQQDVESGGKYNRSSPIRTRRRFYSVALLLDAPPSYGSLFPDRLKPNQIGRRLRRGMSVSQPGDDQGDEEESSSTCCNLCMCLGQNHITSMCSTSSMVLILTTLYVSGCGIFVLGVALGLPIAMITIGKDTNLHADKFHCKV